MMSNNNLLQVRNVVNVNTLKTPLQSHLVLLVIWPVFNILLYLVGLSIATSLSDITGLPNHMWCVIMRLYTLFVLFWFLYQLFGRFNLFFQKHHNLLRKSLSNVTLMVFALFIEYQISSQYSQLPELRTNMLTGANFLFQVVVITTLGHLWQLRLDNFALQINLKQAEIQMLRLQNDPHFLFNTLNLIVTDIQTNPEKAEMLIYDLSDLLRFSLQLSKKTLVSLSEEFLLIKHYLNIQKNRFEDRLIIDIQTTPDAEQAMLPPMLILPLVENAIKHAVAKSIKQTSLSITAKITDDILTIDVTNSRETSPSDNNIQDGQGFRILKETLVLHYPDRHTFTFTNNAQKTTVHVGIPLQHGEPA